MSDSYRKPYCGNSKGSNHWKKQANRKIRRSDEIPDGSHYKKISDSWNSPVENKHAYWDEPKMRRK